MKTIEEILKHREEVQNNILKSFGEDIDIEKAHNVGDVHPKHPDWVWTEYKPGRFDWRASKQKTEEKRETEGKSIDEYAKNASDEVLKKVVDAKNAPTDLKNAAKKELESRIGSKKIENKDTGNFDWNSDDAEILKEHGVTKDNLKVEGDLYLIKTKITSLPENLKVGGDLYLQNTPITSLPDNLEVGGFLDLRDTQITSLPENLKVGGDLYLQNTPITSINNNLEVGGDLSFYNKEITSIGENLKVGGNLSFFDTPITSLPDNLEVGGSLNLKGTLITSLPENLKVGGDLYLEGTSIKVSDFKDTMEIGGKIYLDKFNSKFKFNFV